MDSWAVLATVLWSGLFVALVLGAVGIHRSPSRSGLTLAFAATLLLAGFSFAAALSIGPFTMILTALITALAVARGLPRTTWSFVAALAALGSSFLIWTTAAPLAEAGPLLVPLFCVAAYVIAFVETGQAAAAD